MRRLDSYVRKYGPVEGPEFYSSLQREAHAASVVARKKKRLKRLGLM